MSEYINKAELLKVMFDTYEYEYPTASGAFDEFATMVLPSIINNMPTIDIVHCKECKHRKGKGGVINAISGGVYHWCEKNHKDNDDNWFCADGERKE